MTRKTSRRTARSALAPAAQLRSTGFLGRGFEGEAPDLAARRYAPALRGSGAWWRWASSLLVQDSFVRLGALSLLAGGLGLHLERRYGSRRVLALALAAGLAGNFVDTLIEPVRLCISGCPSR